MSNIFPEKGAVSERSLGITGVNDQRPIPAFHQKSNLVEKPSNGSLCIKLRHSDRINNIECSVQVLCGIIMYYLVDEV